MKENSRVQSCHSGKDPDSTMYVGWTRSFGIPDDVHAVCWTLSSLVQSQSASPDSPVFSNVISAEIKVSPCWNEIGTGRTESERFFVECWGNTRHWDIFGWIENRTLNFFSLTRPTKKKSWKTRSGGGTDPKGKSLSPCSPLRVVSVDWYRD